MLKIGVLNSVRGTGTRKFEGQVALGKRLNGWLYLDINPRWTVSAENVPKYDVRFMPTGWRGAEMKMGAAWEKTAEKSDTDYLSLKMEDPDWRGPLFLLCFVGEEDSSTFDVCWSAPADRAELKDAA